MNKLLNVFHFLPSFAAKEILNNMSDKDRQVLLYQIIDSGPSQSAWNAILELFVSWEENESKTNAIYRCKDLLSRWDITTCSVTSSWRYLFQEDGLSSVARIVKTIYINNRRDYGNRELKVIVQSPYAVNIERLVIHKSEIHEDGVLALVESTQLKNLTQLFLENLTLNDHLIQLLSSSENLNKITSLRLKDLRMTTSRMIILLSGSITKNVNYLDLSYNSLNDKSIHLLATSEKTTNLQTIDLRGNYVGDPGLIELLNSKPLSGLKTLNISSNRISHGAKEKISGSYQHIKVIVE